MKVPGRRHTPVRIALTLGLLAVAVPMLQTQVVFRRPQ